MISDILISIKLSPTPRRVNTLKEPIKRFNVPLTSDCIYTITDVLQKTIRICDGFMLAYSGNLNQAKAAIHHFRELSKTENVTGIRFQEELARVQESVDLSNISLLALISDSGRIFTGGFNHVYNRHKKFQLMKVCGSGANDLIDVFSSYRGKGVNRALSPFVKLRVRVE